MGNTISDAMRRAIRDSGLSLNKLAKQSGVSVSALSRFNNGAPMHTAHFDAMARTLGLRLTPAAPKRKAR